MYAKDDSEKLDILQNNLKLGDRSPMDLMRHLLAASGLEENPSPQFKAIIKDQFLKALSAKVAACSGNWFYQDLIELAKCATEYMKANKCYAEGSTTSDNLKNTSSSSFEGYPLQVRHKQDWDRGFILLLPQTAALPELDAGSGVIKPASSLVIQNRQTSCSMWCPMYRARC